jgi:folylpolyglutamate synthase/dihydropteroate synthase
MSAQRLGEISQDYCSAITVIEDVGESVAYARGVANEDDLILVTGSLFTVGEVRDYLMSKGQ